MVNRLGEIREIYGTMSQDMVEKQLPTEAIIDEVKKAKVFAILDGEVLHRYFPQLHPDNVVPVFLGETPAYKAIITKEGAQYQHGTYYGSTWEQAFEMYLKDIRSAKEVHERGKKKETKVKFLAMGVGVLALGVVSVGTAATISESFRGRIMNLCDEIGSVFEKDEHTH
jgi:hypothetical protein